MTHTMDAQQIYANFHGRAAGTAGLQAARQIVGEMADRYEEAAAWVQEMADHVRSAWQGTAAEAALQGLVPLAENSLFVSEQLDTAQDLIARQIESFHTAAAEVRPVPVEPRLQDVVKLALSGDDLSPMVDQMRAYQAAQQANVDAYAKYQAASEYNTTNLPSLSGSLALDHTPVSITPPAAERPSAGPVADRTVSGQNAPGPVSTARPGATLPHDTGSPSTSTARSPGPGRGGAAEGPVPVPAGPAEPGRRPALDGDVTPTEASAAPVTDPITGRVVDRSTGGVLDRSDDRNSVRVVDRAFGRLPDPVAGRTADPGRGRADGARAGEGWTGGRAGGRAGAARSGGRAGVATEPAVVEEPAPGSAPTAVGPVAGGRRRDDEDEEHRTRFVLAEDGETRFGREEKVAPRVIGE